MACPANDISQRPLQNAMRLVKVAIQLDSGNRPKEAYCEYLRSVNYISHALLQDAAFKAGGEMEEVEVGKMVKLAEQCLERIKSFIGKRNQTSVSNSSPTPVQASSLAQITPQTSTKTLGTFNRALMDSSKLCLIEQNSQHRRVFSEGKGEDCPFLPPELFQKLQVVESQDNKKELTPIEEASCLNQKLKANYEARLARLAPGQATQKTSLTLSLQRQMMENLIIARARQDALQRKMEERRLRLQEQANRKFSCSAIMTPEEQEQRILYANILEYEQDHDWPKVWKANLKKNPNDATLVSGLVTYLLSCPDHPVVKLLKKLQYQVYNRLYPIISQTVPPSPTPGHSVHLKLSHSAQNLLLPQSPPSLRKPGLSHSLSDASISLSPLPDLNANNTASKMDSEELLTPVPPDRENSFEDLEQYMTQLGWASACAEDTVSDLTFDLTHSDMDAHVQDLEERALKEHLKATVKDIHNAIDRLLSLCLLSFECLNTASSKDQCVACIEEVFFTPIWGPLLALFRKVHRDRELAFESSVLLYHNASPGDVGVADKLFPKDPAVLHGSYPYECAVQELKLLCKDCCPQKKLECIVRTLRLICACAEHYHVLQENDPSPKTAAIYLIGEEGYCLTSMQSALTYVESLHLGGALQLAAKPT
ncbi:VPS9 domain-containing protein 1 isoform X2 [Ictalurus furcatus]|uniref:VPS9 domain-containing protein 1 isoform X2 n=1 Tax=Ictalurus furcatus TaxID=66913 RepID=UPI00234FBFEC|nr:VPS9 domain-containing protein 1 isoform X2 [Ictalurus furcatus]